MAHELSHVKNRDVMIMTIASFFASIASMIPSSASSSAAAAWATTRRAPGFLVVLLVSLAVYVISFFLMLALSRYREFAADRGAALITGRPSALASALDEDLRPDGARARSRTCAPPNDMNAFFIVPAEREAAVQTIFATHPPMEKRIERLQQLEGQLQAPLGAAA